MGKTGRNAFVALDVTQYGEPGRIPPPAGLGQAEKRAFTDLITSVPASQFVRSDLALLTSWAETVALRERMAARIAVEGEITEAGKVNPAVAIHREAVKTLIALALRLRVSPQARRQEPPRQKVVTSYYERLDLEAVADDAERDQ
jgi:phage terminase small subunit